jgi:hypothetical protein
MMGRIILSITQAAYLGISITGQGPTEAVSASKRNFKKACPLGDIKDFFFLF